MPDKDAEQGVLLSIVIPAYNEERRIGATLDAILSYLDRRDGLSEIIVVDDGSSDGTAELVRRRLPASGLHRLIARAENRGKGYSVREGIMSARGEYLLFSDADLSTPIEEADRLLSFLESGACDVAIGSRSIKGSVVEIHQPWWRELMGKTFNFLVRFIALRGFRDTQCGFKCFTRQAAHTVFPRMRIQRFGFDVEALYIAKMGGFRIEEVPVRWVNSPFSTVDPLIDSSRMILDLVRIRVNHLLGRYRHIQTTATHPEP